MTGFRHSPALLDRIHMEMMTRGKPEPLAALVGRFLKTRDGSLGRGLLRALLERDARFRVEGDTVFPVFPKERLSEEILCDVEFAVLDFETNGLGRSDRAVEVGISCVKGGEETESFASLINPGTPLSPFVTRLTGIRQADLEGKPTFEEVWPEVRALLAGRVLVAHNLPFDRRILLGEVARLGGNGLARVGELCTLRLARRLLPKEESKSLDALVDRFGLAIEARHRALGDARATGKVLFKLLDLAADKGTMVTWGHLARFLEGNETTP